jgi:hypothetical protein
MRKPAKILLAGTLVAILPCGAATSQEAPDFVLNDQVQVGDVFANQTLDVVEVLESTTATTTATGNAYSFGADGANADVRSNQTVQGDVEADTRLDVGLYGGPATRLTTAATGNTGDATVSGGAAMTGVFTQNTGAVSIYGHSHIEAPDAEMGDVTATAQAIGNSQGFAPSYASTGVRVNQTNAAEVVSDGGGTIGATTGSTVFAATSTANNVTNTGSASAAERMIINQRNNAALTQAGQFTAFGSSYLATTAATASGNNVSATNEGPLLDVTNDQGNEAYVRAQSENSSYQFSASQVSAYALGNSILAGDLNGELVLDNTQTNNGGGVEAVASFTGEQGYDATVSSTAMGNAATGYACGQCVGMDIESRQVNNADVGATSTVNVGGYARSVNGVATAVGNTATYYMTRPGS